MRNMENGMPRIPEPEIERLKSEVSVQRLVESSNIELKKSGKERRGQVLHIAWKVLGSV
jgi:hypothetical protein